MMMTDKPSSRSAPAPATKRRASHSNAALSAVIVLFVSVLAAGATAQLDADFTAAPTSGVAALSVAFNDTTTGGAPLAWVWDFGDGGASTLLDPSPTHTYVSPGTYSVALTVLASGGVSDTETKVGFVTVMPANLVADFNASPTQGTNPLTVSFSDDSTGGTITNWIWDFGDGSSSAQKTPTHTYLAPGKHDVSLTVIVGTESDTLVQAELITVNPAPLVVDFSASVAQGIIPTNVLFSDDSTGAAPTAWSWDFGDGAVSTLQSPSHTYSAVGSYDVALTAFVEQQPVTKTEADFITIVPSPLVADFSAAPTPAANPLTMSFADESTGEVPTAWIWSFGDGSSSLAQNPTHEYMAPGTFTVSLQVSGGQQSAATSQPVTADTGQFDPLLVLASALNTPMVHPADLDGDGDVDLLTANSGDLFFGGDSIYWLENTDGLGSFGPASFITTAIDGPASVFAADLDGDGDADALSASVSDDMVAWYENVDGSGAFGPRQVITMLADAAFDIHSADLDGDGDMDVLSASFLDSKIAWYENTDGQGGFGPQQVITTAFQFAASVHAEDFDGDGDSDVLSQASLVIAWYENTDGLGSFGAGQIITTTTNTLVSVTVADLDGDGDSDLLSSESISNKIVWYENTDGLGSFGPEQLITVAPSSVFQAEAADLDGDQDLDVLAASWVSDVVVWYENTDGLGSFGPQQVISTSVDFLSDIRVADLDGDGDADVLAYSAGEGEIVLFANTLGTPAWPFLGNGLAGSSDTPLLSGSGALTPGEVVTLTLSNALPGSSAALVFGLSAINAPFKGGLLVPHPDLIFSGLPVDAAGETVLNLSWPPGFPAGVTFWLQHWITDPAGPQGLAASNALSATTSP